MSTVAPVEQITIQPPNATPAALGRPPRIVANRTVLMRRFPSLGFTISTGGLPYWEVLLFTQPSLVTAANAGLRTPATFYSSRQDGGLRPAAPTGDSVFL